MKKLRTLSLILSLGASPLACNKPTEDSDLSWGHLNDNTLNPSAPLYLINKGPDEVYKVCVAQYMVDALPGIEEEIKAAINIWASYLGRTITVETTVVAQDLPKIGDNSNSLRDTYSTNCGPKVDVVMGLSPFSGGTVGQTGYSALIFNSTDIRDFKRHLFLRDFSIKTLGETDEPKRWISLQELNNQPTLSQDLLTRMQERDTKLVAPKGTAIALPVLVHEFGHVWGLCDQYESANNCSPDDKFHSEHKDLNSIMAASSNIAKIYLTDDDITGIRALANRSGFNSKWPGTEDELAQKAKPVNLAEVTFFKLNSVQKQGLEFKLDFGVVTTSKGGELHFEYRRKGTEAWQTSSTFYRLDHPFMLTTQPQTITVRTDGEYEFRLNLRLKGDDDALMAPLYTTL